MSFWHRFLEPDQLDAMRAAEKLALTQATQNFADAYSGMTAAQVASRHGVDTTTARKWARQLQVTLKPSDTPKRRKYPGVTNEIVRNMRSQGLTDVDIARKLDCPYRIIAKRGGLRNRITEEQWETARRFVKSHGYRVAAEKSGITISHLYRSI